MKNVSGMQFGRREISKKTRNITILYIRGPTSPEMTFMLETTALIVDLDTYLIEK